MSRDISVPGLAATAAPEFSDPATCKAWLENVPLNDVAAAQALLAGQLREFNRMPTRAANRLAVLETLRDAVAFVQIEQAKRFFNRALPMADSDAEIFERTVELWEYMRTGYLRCLDAAEAGEVRTRPQVGRICQRVLAYAGLKTFHHHRAYREVPAREWRALHAVYAKAEALGVQDEPVKDFLNRDVPDTSPRVAYLRALLMAISGPHELNQRQLTFVAYLLERWAGKVKIVGGRPPGAVAWVDLAGDALAERSALPAAAETRPGLRYLDVRSLERSLRGRINRMRKGVSPAELGLGEDCVQPSCEQLLVFLYRQWCGERAPRVVVRRGRSEAIQACVDMAAIRYYISGKVFRQPGEQADSARSQREEITNFGRAASHAGEDEDYSVARGFILEHWQLIDQEATGMRMLRKASYPGKRYVHAQLIAVRPSDSKNFMLGMVKWMACAQNGDFSAGVKLLPGLPVPTAVRLAGEGAKDEKYVEALSLTAVPSLNAPPALVIPLGWYKPGRLLEVYMESPVQVSLGELLERGADFERVAYEVVAGA